MNRYVSRLGRLVELRQRQLEIAEAALASAAAEVAEAERRALELKRQAENAFAIARSFQGATRAADLRAAARWADTLEEKAGQESEQAEEVRRSLPKLRAAVLRARRDKEVVESLEARRRKEWQREVDRRAELETSDLHQARRLARRR